MNDLQYITIRLMPGGFSFARTPQAVLTADGNEYETEFTHVEVTPGPEFHQRLQNAILDAIPTEHDYAQLVCEVVTTRVLMLPENENAEALMRLTLSQTTEPEQLLTQAVPTEKNPDTGHSVLAFGIDRTTYHFLLRNYSEVTFVHPLATLIRKALYLAQGTCLVARCDSQMLDLVLLRDDRIGLVNCYCTQQADNRCYYVMNTWIRQGLDQLKDSLLVIGPGTEALQVRANLHRFIKHVFS